MERSETVIKLDEPSRRKPGAAGAPIMLADGDMWLMALPAYRADREPLTSPDVDAGLSRLYDSLILENAVVLSDVYEVAKTLLQTNYDLALSELEELLSVDDGVPCREFVTKVVEALFGEPSPSRTFVDWVRLSLIAAGLQRQDVQSAGLPGLLSILVSTGKTVPPSSFIDSNRLAQENSELDRLL